MSDEISFILLYFLVKIIENKTLEEYVEEIIENTERFYINPSNDEEVEELIKNLNIHP